MRNLLPIALLSLAACEVATTSSPPAYRPEEAGTVDHALCLLGFTAVPLIELASGHHLVKARLNGRAATFVLDTGANATVLNAPYAEQFGVEGGLPGGAVGLGGAMQASAARIDELVIGGVPIRQSRIMVTDLGQLSRLLEPMAGREIHGIVGQDVMNEHRAVIDVARPILYLIEGNEEPAPVSQEQCRRDAEAEGASAGK